MPVDRIRRFAIIRPYYFRQYGEIVLRATENENRHFYSAFISVNFFFNLILNFSRRKCWIHVIEASTFLLRENFCESARPCELRIWRTLKEAIFQNFSRYHDAFKFHDTWCCKAKFIIYSMKINNMVTRLAGHYRSINRFMLMNL